MARLMREYIHHALYSSPTPYFSKPVIASSAAALPFHAMLGQSEYNARVAALYAASERGWLTPVELFAPWYSYAIARSVLEGSGGAAAPLRVYEVGGGTGANARHFLDYVRASAPALYARPGGVSYTILEISPELRQRQAEALEGAGHGLAVARSLCVDALRAHERLQPDARPCTVLALEVLDNLPHDKIVCLDGVLHETWVEEAAAAAAAAAAPLQRREVYRPLADPLLVDTWRCMEAHGARAPALAPAHRALTLPLAALCRALPRSPAEPPPPPGFQWALHAPTGSLALLRALRLALPAHSLLLADFSHLPHPRLRPAASASAASVACHAPADALPGCGGPPWAAVHLRGLTAHPGGKALASGPAHRLTCSPLLVASRGARGAAPGEQVDWPTYLSPPTGEADIFFPTDFELLQCLVEGSGGRGVSVEASHAFLTRHAQCERTTTLTGFNPMLETYANTRFLRSQ